jgi:hypothetical protein
VLVFYFEKIKFKNKKKIMDEDARKNESDKKLIAQLDIRLTPFD